MSLETLVRPTTYEDESNPEQQCPDEHKALKGMLGQFKMPQGPTNLRDTEIAANTASNLATYVQFLASNKPRHYTNEAGIREYTPEYEQILEQLGSWKNASLEARKTLSDAEWYVVNQCMKIYDTPKEEQKEQFLYLLNTLIDYEVRLRTEEDYSI